MIEMLRRVRARIPNLALGVIVGMLVGGGAFAVAQTAKPDDGGVHGGPKPRFHDAKICNLVDVKKLEGNWTHGDYVSAVEKKDPSKVREAAHSPCGKPNHGGASANEKQKKDGTKTKEPSEKTEAPKPKPSTPGSPTAAPSTSPSPTASTPSATPESPSPSPSSKANTEGLLTP